MRVATDVGGTFTDLVCIDADGIRIVKVDTTPPNFEQGVLDAVTKAGLRPTEFDDFVHGTTVVINALLSRRGVKTALITTRGFRDVLEIARGNRPDLFNFAFQKPIAFVPRFLRKEITERLDYQGRIVHPIALDEIEAIVAELKREKVEAIAISFLHAYVNPAHELAAEEVVRRAWPEVSVIASHKVCGEWREYERTSTAVLSAYVHPIAQQYLASLERKLRDKGLRGRPYIMRSNGGIATVDGAQNDPISMVESGPASGVLGAAALGKQIGELNLIALDIGGTTAKTALIEGGKVRITTEYKIEWNRTNPGYPIRTPVVDLVEIGNGGGSIAWIDEGERLHVGPQSAGASPGPAAYGRGGTAPTTTDANLILGRINAEMFLGGEQKPDFDNVQRAFWTLAARLGGTVEDVARGVVRIANANMVNALKLVSLNRGYDPREFALIAFGGGGPMHAVALAEELMARKVIIPVNASVFSAWGMLMCDLRRDFLRTKVVSVSERTLSEISDFYEQLSKHAIEVCVAEGMPHDQLRTERYADMRYEGQEHTVKVLLSGDGADDHFAAGAIEAFHVAHEREYTFRLEVPVEIVNFHIVVLAEIKKHDLLKRAVTGRGIEDVKTGARRVNFDEAGWHEAQIYDAQRFEPEMAITGPAIVEDITTTIVIPPGKRASMDAYGNIHIEMRPST